MYTVCMVYICSDYNNVYGMHRMYGIYTFKYMSTEVVVRCI